MKTLKNILTAWIAVSMIISFPVFAAAHNGHENARLPLVWIFSDNVKNKINKARDPNPSMMLVGLSHMEQRSLERYGIKVGHAFYTETGRSHALVERTSSGIRIVDGMTAAGPDVHWQVPVMEGYQAVPSSFIEDDHAGHHHKHLNVAWLFDPKIVDKIKRHLESGKPNLSIGLSVTEQKILENYGIKLGHSFISTVSGNDYFVKRTTTGLVMRKNAMDAGPVASAPTVVFKKEVRG